MKKVLVVDDSQLVRAMVTRYLDGYGCAVLEATDGRQAVAAAAVHQPDLILLDLVMPVLDGSATLAELRGDEACRHIPVVVLTTDERENVSGLDVQGRLVKPFGKEAFDRAVGWILGAGRGAGAAAHVDAGAVLERVREATATTTKTAVSVPHPVQ